MDSILDLVTRLGAALIRYDRAREAFLSGREKWEEENGGTYLETRRRIKTSFLGERRKIANELDKINHNIKISLKVLNAQRKKELEEERRRLDEARSEALIRLRRSYVSRLLPLFRRLSALEEELQPLLQEVVSFAGFYSLQRGKSRYKVGFRDFLLERCLQEDEKGTLEEFLKNNLTF